jgi:hypothetical protein
MRRLARIVVPLLAAVLIAPATSSGAQGMEIALQDDAVFVARQYFRVGPALDLSRELRTSRLRVNVLWSQVVRPNATARRRPRKVRYDFVSYDQVVVAARARGMQVQMALTGPAPAWATGNRKIGPYKPRAKDYAHFVRATVRHFGPHVTRYSIWNEPNHTGWLAPLKSQPALYRSLYKAGYSALRKANRSAQVLIGETAPYARNKKTAQPPLRFLRAMVKGTKLRAHGVAHHPYEYSHPPEYDFPGRDNVTIGTLGRLTAELDRQASAGRLRSHDGRPLPVFLTEFGYLRQGRFRLSDDVRGDYLRRAFHIAQTNPRVVQMLHYLLVEPGKKYAFFDTSLVGRNGGRSSAFNALAQWAQAAAADGRGGGFPGGGGGNPPPRPPPYKNPL